MCIKPFFFLSSFFLFNFPFSFSLLIYLSLSFLFFFLAFSILFHFLLFFFIGVYRKFFINFFSFLFFYFYFSFFLLFFSFFPFLCFLLFPLPSQKFLFFSLQDIYFQMREFLGFTNTDLQKMFLISPRIFLCSMYTTNSFENRKTKQLIILKNDL